MSDCSGFDSLLCVTAPAANPQFRNKLVCGLRKYELRYGWSFHAVFFLFHPRPDSQKQIYVS